MYSEIIGFSSETKIKFSKKLDVVKSHIAEENDLLEVLKIIKKLNRD